MSAYLSRLLRITAIGLPVLLGLGLALALAPAGAAAQDATGPDSLGDPAGDAPDEPRGESVEDADAGGGSEMPGVKLHKTSPERIRVRVDTGGNREYVTRSADYVRFGDNVHVKAGERVAGNVVSIGGSVLVEGKISGDCVSVGGSIQLAPNAIVTGDVVGVGGTVTVEERAEIMGDVVSVWGRLDAHDTAQILGEQVEVRGLGAVGLPVGPIFVGENYGLLYDLGSFVRRVIWIVILLGLGLLSFQIFPSRMERLTQTATDRGLVAFLAGFAGWILWLPAFLLLMITIIGIPVAILLIFLTPIILLLGYLAVAASTGRKLGGRFFGAHPPNWKTVLLGVVALEITLLVARLFGVAGSVFGYFGWILSMVGWCIIFIAGTTGFGAFLMTRFRPVSDETAGPWAGPAPPPPPPGPYAPAPPAPPSPPPPPPPPPANPPPAGGSGSTPPPSA